MRLLAFILILLPFLGEGQRIEVFSRYDSLRGTEGKFRQYDVTFYDLLVSINPDKKTIKGANTITFYPKSNLAKLQIDLSSRLSIDSIEYHFTKVKYIRDSDFVFVEFPSPLQKSIKDSITIFYSGKPKESNNPPWDGGVVWAQDSLGRTWSAVACEAIGANIWWPCKDSWQDEADSARLTYVVSYPFQCISNGVLQSVKKEDTLNKFTWNINYPVNNYNITFNIGSYVHFSDTLVQKNGKPLPLDYYVLDYNKSKAAEHFKQVPMILKTLGELFGPYPFYKDGYALIESPYWGMEHQSAIAYGNNFKNQFYDYDYIIVHETAHEWWGNSLTAADHADMWIHEAFATYSEALFVEKLYGYDESIRYLTQQKQRILNKNPISGPKGVNYHFYDDTDQYYKGAWMLHTIRNVVNNDSVWYSCLKALQKSFGKKIIDGQTVISFISNFTGKDLSPVFEQYTKHAELPVFEYTTYRKGKKSILKYKWNSPVPDFHMPLEVLINGKTMRLEVQSGNFNTITLENKVKTIEVNKEKFLVEVRKG